MNRFGFNQAWIDSWVWSRSASFQTDKVKEIRSLLIKVWQVIAALRALNTAWMQRQKCWNIWCHSSFLHYNKCAQFQTISCKNHKPRRTNPPKCVCESSSLHCRKTPASIACCQLPTCLWEKLKTSLYTQGSSFPFPATWLSSGTKLQRGEETLWQHFIHCPWKGEVEEAQRHHKENRKLVRLSLRRTLWRLFHSDFQKGAAIRVLFTTNIFLFSAAVLLWGRCSSEKLYIFNKLNLQRRGTEVSFLELAVSLFISSQQVSIGSSQASRSCCRVRVSGLKWPKIAKLWCFLNIYVYICVC